MRKKLLQYGISTVIGLLISLWVMDTEAFFDIPDMPLDLMLMILCDALFVPGIFFVMFGALLWIASTGLFDSITYAFRTAAHMFLPFLSKDRKSFYDYKTEKAEKRADTPKFIFVVGIGFLALSGAALAGWAIVTA